MAKKIPTSVISSETNKVARLIYKGNIKPGGIDREQTRLMAQELMRGVFQGYGKTFKDLDPKSGDYQILSRIENNVHAFSGAKSYQELREFSHLIMNESKEGIIPYHKFEEAVRAIDNTYNKNYLQTEYHTALRQSKMAEYWQEIKSEKEDFPNLEYVSVEGDTTCDICSELDGSVYPVDDPFWDTYYPLNHYGCLCTVEPTTGDLVEAKSLPEVPDMFDNNVGENGEVFPDTAPYFSIPGNDAKTVMSEIGILSPGRWENFKESEVLLKDKEFTNVEFNKDSGGFTAEHIKHGPDELKQNMIIGQELSKEGFGIKLLEDVGGKSADAEFHLKGEWEFKTLSNFTSPAKAVQGAIRRAKSQAENIVLFIEKPIESHQLSKGIYDAVSFDKKKQIKNVMIKFKGKKSLTVSRKEIESGRAAQLIEKYFN